MDFVNIVKVQDEQDKYELYIGGKRACRGNLAAVVATINVNLPFFQKDIEKKKKKPKYDPERQFYTDLIVEENEQK